MRARRFFAGVALFLALSPANLFAQAAIPDSAKERARKLAEQGFDAMDAGYFMEAFQLFHEADETFHATTLALMQGHAAAKLGRLLKARAQYQRVANERLPPNAPKEFHESQDEARSTLQALAARIPTIRIRVLNTSGGARVTIDGIEIPQADVNGWVDQDPGAHKIEVSMAGFVSTKRTITLSEGTHEDVRIELISISNILLPAPAPAPAPSVQSQLPTINAKPDSSRPSTIAFAAGGVSLGVGMVIGGVWVRKNNDILRQCDAHSSCPADLAPNISTAKTLGGLALSSLVLGGLGLGVGVVLLTTQPDSSRRTAKPGPSLAIGPGSLGISGTF